MNLTTIRNLAIAQATSVLTPRQATLTGTGLVEAFINQGYHEIEATEAWPFSEAAASVNTTSGSNSLTGMPTDLGIILSAFNTTADWNLTFMDLRQVRYDSSTGSPTHYGQFAGTWYVWPQPTAVEAISFYYYKIWADLGASDSPLFPATFHPLLVDYGAYKLLEHFASVDAELVDIAIAGASSLKGQFYSGLNRMKDSYLTQRTQDAIPSQHLMNELYTEDW